MGLARDAVAVAVEFLPITGLPRIDRGGSGGTGIIATGVIDRAFERLDLRLFGRVGRRPKSSDTGNSDRDACEDSGAEDRREKALNKFPLAPTVVSGTLSRVENGVLRHLPGL